jgi:hypothetical protein
LAAAEQSRGEKPRLSKRERKKTKQSKSGFHNPPREIIKPTIRAIDYFNMIKDGDSIMVCISGRSRSPFLHLFSMHAPLIAPYHTLVRSPLLHMYGKALTPLADVALTAFVLTVQHVAKSLPAKDARAANQARATHVVGLFHHHHPH